MWWVRVRVVVWWEQEGKVLLMNLQYALSPTIPPPLLLCVCVRMCVRVRACVCVCVHARACV